MSNKQQVVCYRSSAVEILEGVFDSKQLLVAKAM